MDVGSILILVKRTPLLFKFFNCRVGGTNYFLLFFKLPLSKPSPEGAGVAVLSSVGVVET